MIIQALAFYMFALIAIASGVMVVSAKNPVHSVLFLILAFFNMIPIPPLDGSHILENLLPYEAARKYAALRPYGFMVLMLALYFNLLSVFFLPARLVFNGLMSLVQAVAI